jgi:hypothetical protein
LDLGTLKLVSIIPGYVYDPKRHQLPSAPSNDDKSKQFDTPATPISPFLVKYPTLAPLAWKIHQLTDTPYLMPEHYAIVFSEIAREINENSDYQWTRTSKTVRDRCVEKSVPVARSHVNFILTGLYNSGYPLGKEIPVDVSKLAKKMTENIVVLCKNAQIQLNNAEIRLIAEWMGVQLHASDASQQ